ncbi:prolipoprotein diacylglyceryl transferase [Mycoplasmatota bacterium WC44]
MFDNHYTPEGYGIIKNLNLLGLQISSYTFFVGLGILLGLIFWYLSLNKSTERRKYSFEITISALLGGLIGSKIPVLIENRNLIQFNNETLWIILVSGKSIVGGLIGGFIGIYIVKHLLGIKKMRFGNDIAPAVVLAMAIGRIGCFLTGCCYGVESHIHHLGIDFGDGIYRYPTQLVELVFCLLLFGYFIYLKSTRELKPGELYLTLVIYYLSFRFVIEFIRATPKDVLYLSIYQVVSLLVILFIILKRKVLNYGK